MNETFQIYIVIKIRKIFIFIQKHYSEEKGIMFFLNFTTDPDGLRKIWIFGI